MHITTMLLADTFSTPTFSWNLVDDINALLQYPYMRHAFVAGAIVAIMSAAIGWFAVLRSEAYATHTLSLIGFPGAAGATLIGLQPLLGYFVFCISGALAFPLLNKKRGNAQSESATVASVQAFALALGVLFVSLYSGYLNGINTFLFGTFLGITFQQVMILAVVGSASLICLSIIRHQLLFASVDSTTARASGISVRLIDSMFLVLLGITVAATAQYTGALLAFTLTITPAAIGQMLTPRQPIAVLIASILGVSFAWLALTLAYFTSYPVGVFVTSLAFGTYVAVCLMQRLRR